MKKYWKLTTLVLVIVVIFSAYYINNKDISKSFPQLRIHTLEGEEQAVNSLVINGDLSIGLYSMEPFRITNDGITYLRDESFVTRLKGYYYSAEITRLQEKYRNFMRGKEAVPDYYYETDEKLVYAAIPYNFNNFNNDHFKIAVLDKQTNKTISFTVPFPDRGKYTYVDSYGMTYGDQKLHMVTINGNKDNREVYLYTFDTEKEQLVNTQLVGELPAISYNTGYETVDVLFDESADSDQVIVIQSLIEYVEPSFEGGRHTETVKTEKVIQYNLTTNVSEEISLAENENIGLPLAINQENLYFVTVDQQKLIIADYDLNGGEIKEQLEIPLTDADMSLSDVQQAVMTDQTFYFVPSIIDRDSTGSIVIVDLDSFSLRYYGEIENTNLQKEGELVSGYFNRIEVVN